MKRNSKWTKNVAKDINEVTLLGPNPTFVTPSAIRVMSIRRNPISSNHNANLNDRFYYPSTTMKRFDKHQPTV